MADITVMKTFRLSLWFPSGPPSTLPGASSRVEVCPPALDAAPAGRWKRLVFGWAARPLGAGGSRTLAGVHSDFLAAIADLEAESSGPLGRRIQAARSLRELWHLRAAVYSAVALAHSQSEAERRLSGLNRHFPTKAPRPGFAAPPS